MKILREVDNLFLPDVMKDKCFEEKYVRASSMHKKHKNNHGCLGCCQLEDCLPTRHHHKAPV